MRIKQLIVVAAFLFVLVPSEVFAGYCACCAETGHYSIGVQKLSDYERGELKRLQIVDATLFTDAGYPESIRGILPLGDNFSAGFMLEKNSWKFSFQDEKKNTGVLSLAQAATFVDFRADIHDTEETSMRNLYKEIRFKSKVKSGTGIFRNGIDPMTEYFLVFQGRGNNCMNAEDFTHWRLEITGKKAEYAFFGKLKTNEK